MTLSCIILLVIFAFCASFAQRVTGFGFGIFVMAVLPYILPSYAESTALSGMLAMVGVSITGFRMRRYVVWSKLWPIMITFLVISFFSVKVVGGMRDDLLRRILGGFLIVISIYFVVFSGKIRIKPTLSVQLGMGTISGIMGGLFAIQGPPAVIYFLSSSDSKEEYIAEIAFYFIIGNAMMTGYRALNGFVTRAVLISWVIALPAVLLGLWVGNKVFDRMPVEILRRVVYGFMAVAGALALFQ